MTTWSPQQNEALSKAGAWLRMKWSPWFYLAGYAGTGKSTLAMHLAQHEKGKVAFAAYTGKAAQVMRRKGCVGARTIHSLIYVTETDPNTGKVTSTLKPQAELEGYSLIVVDEVSMVDEQVGADLLSFGIPILVLGDPAQLPPVNGGGYFTGRDPDYMLTEIHRQAAESPIVRLATEIREGRFRPTPTDEPGLIVGGRRDLDPRLVRDADIVIVGKNDTRRKSNAWLREKAGRTGVFPVVGESLICLRNDRGVQVFNGEIFTATAVKALTDKIKMKLTDSEQQQRPVVEVEVLKDFFEDDVKASKLPFKELHGTQQFTYGYAITCHKAQGSQWANTCVFDESETFREDAGRWLYTAVTRASEHLTLVI